MGMHMLNNINILKTSISNAYWMKQCLENHNAHNVVNKINNKVKFLYCQNSFLTSALRHLLCSASKQLHFDYACSAWYLNLIKKLRHRIQSTFGYS